MRENRSVRASLNNYILIGQSPVVEPDLLTWAEWFEHADRKVAQTDVGPYVVSTVFLGIDHQHLGKGPPILFETMVFIDGDAEDIQQRCSTWLEAEAQHAEVVELVRNNEASRSVGEHRGRRASRGSSEHR